MSGSELLQAMEGLQRHHNAMSPLWRECRRLCSPIESATLATSKDAPTVIRQVSAHAIMALQRLTTDLMANVMPATGQWWRYKPVRVLRDRKALAHWLSDVSEVSMELLQSSNFYSACQPFLTGRACDGTVTLRTSMLPREQALVADEDEGDLSFDVIPAQEAVIEEDRRGRVIRWFLTHVLTASKALQEFGDQCPAVIAEQAREPSKSQTEHEFVQVIWKRKTNERQGSAQEKMPWASVWVDRKTKATVKTSGYAYQPCFTARWERWNPRSPYGISPAMIALAEVKGINLYEELLATLGQIAVEPRIKIPVSHDGPVDLGPGGITKVIDSTGPEEWATAGQLAWGMEMLGEKKKIISDIFLNGVFAPLAGIERGMTMFEADSRKKEQLGRAMPAVQLMTEDLFNPFLETLFTWGFESGKFPEPPEEAFVFDAAGRGKLVFPSIAQTNRFTLENQADTEGKVTRIFQTLAPLVQVAGPGVYDFLNTDEIGRELAEEANLKTKLIRTPAEAEEVAAMREQARQAQQAMELAAKNPELVAGAAQMMGGEA